MRRTPPVKTPPSNLQSEEAMRLLWRGRRGQQQAHDLWERLQRMTHSRPARRRIDLKSSCC
jgi:hypothetical protein